MANQSTARDVFMYLLVLVVLSMSATSLGLLLFDLVDVYLPDPLTQNCSYDGCIGSINVNIAVLLVAFSVLVWAWRFLQRDLKANPAKADLWVRRWLLYFSLFVSGIASIIDLIVLVTNFLNGDLPLSFVLRVGIVLVIALAVFYYFLRELHPKKGRGGSSLVAWGSSVAVVASLAVGVYTSAPWEARERNADMQRVNDLSMLQGELVNYWQNKRDLPGTLDQLKDPIRGFNVPVDPVTNQPYEYTRKSVTAFELCTTFTTASRGGTGKDSVARPVAYYPGDPYGGDWRHDIGHTCFQRDIDPKMYPKPLQP